MQTSTHDLTIGSDEVRKRFVEWNRGEAEREWACLTVLADHAPGLAPRPLRREEEDGAPVVVMERLPGRPLGGAPLTPRQTVALGAALRRLYDVPVDAARDAGIGTRRGGPSSIVPRLVDWMARDQDLTPCLDPELVAQAVARASEWLRDPSLPPPRTTALGIADLNPANVLWDGEVCRLVDFEDGGLSDPAYELADHVEHMAARPGVYDVVALADAVGLPADDRERGGRVPATVGSLLVGDAAPGEGCRELASQPAGDHRGAGGPPPGSDGRVVRTRLRRPWGTASLLDQRRQIRPRSRARPGAAADAGG